MRRVACRSSSECVHSLCLIQRTRNTNYCCLIVLLYLDLSTCFKQYEAGGAGLKPHSGADLRWLLEKGLVYEAFYNANKRTACWLIEQEQQLEQTNLFSRLVAEALRETGRVDAAAIECREPLQGRKYFLTGDKHGDGFEFAAVCRPDRIFEREWSKDLFVPSMWDWLPAYYFNYLQNANLGPQTLLTESDTTLKCETEISQDTLTRGTVAEITLREFPLPGPHTSFDQILEFRDDQDVRHSRIALRHWMVQAATKESRPIEIADELGISSVRIRATHDVTQNRIKSGLHSCGNRGCSLRRRKLDKNQLG